MATKKKEDALDNMEDGIRHNGGYSSSTHETRQIV